jgi:hypothetical protein
MKTDLKVIFESLKKELKRYNRQLTSKVDDESHFDLWTTKEVVIAGRKRKEVYFAGLIIQKSYVGFYYMPVYAKPEMKKTFSPELLKLLKGKSCFHFTKLDNTLLIQIRDTLARGFECYKKNGWV